MDMSQYQGEDREQVIAGYQIVLGLQALRDGLNVAFHRVRKTANYVALGGYLDGPLLNLLVATDLLGGPQLSQSEAVLILAYLKACNRVQRVVERLQ